ncbi:MAG TPA: 5-oxoprolinase subunit PxpB [Chloroflexia bacterium]|nr:5-oxoprolinase subunit PxpB [Chloroflexia bacterium]
MSNAGNRDRRLFALGESATLVSLGEGISVDVSSRARHLARCLSERLIPGVTDIVPAYNSVLVAYDESRLDNSALEQTVGEIAAGTTAGREVSTEHVVPVRYGDEAGPDLDDLAATMGLTPAEVVRLHTQPTYTVAFLGFLPGFPYMYEVPSRIAVPRRATPRVSVPAGSVGIAALQTGIYPFASPGGWQIIGQTPLQLWDATAADPAYFAPGDRVRFVPTAEPRAEQSPARAPVARQAALEVLAGGALTTVQDLGRHGHAHFGVGPAGVFDIPAARLANSLVGNDTGAALLEMTFAGPALRAVEGTTIALTGADFGCTVDGIRVPPGISWFVRPGSTIRFGAPSVGLRGYLAVAGGIDVPLLLGSRSTSAYGGFGGFAGRPLRAGDVLGVVEPPTEAAALAGRLSGEVGDAPAGQGTKVVRYIPYRGPQSLGHRARLQFEQQEWAVSERSDRMGLRLAGEAALDGSGGELASFPVIRGAIQVPPDGQPIVLGPDHQTTGGYPVLGVAARCDWPVLAQAAPGSVLRFAAVEVDEARALARAAPTT